MLPCSRYYSAPDCVVPNSPDFAFPIFNSGTDDGSSQIWPGNMGEFAAYRFRYGRIRQLLAGATQQAYPAGPCSEALPGTVK